MTLDKGVVSQRQLLERSSGILAECSASCLQLQDVLSPLVTGETHLRDDAVIQMQALDRISQQLEDLSRLLGSCSVQADTQPSVTNTTINGATRLHEVREAILGLQHTEEDGGASDLDLF